MCVCVYLIVKDDHDKHAKQHRLHQEDDVVSTEGGKQSKLNSWLIFLCKNSL